VEDCPYCIKLSRSSNTAQREVLHNQTTCTYFPESACRSNEASPSCLWASHPRTVSPASADLVHSAASSHLPYICSTYLTLSTANQGCSQPLPLSGLLLYTSVPSNHSTGPKPRHAFPSPLSLYSTWPVHLLPPLASCPRLSFLLPSA
jgi:hypothetical protein